MRSLGSGRARRLGYRLAWHARRAYWFVIRPRTQGVCCIVVHDGHWLMVRHTYGRRRWTFPGGGLHRGEVPDLAARREVAEEVGLQLDAVRLIGTYGSRRDHSRDTVWCFLADVEAPDAVADGIEIAEVRWVDPDALPEDRSRSVDDVVALLAAREV